MIVKETFLLCDSCGASFGVDDRQRTATEQRKEARRNGWKLISGDGYNYGDYCPDCLNAKKHKK